MTDQEFQNYMMDLWNMSVGTHFTRPRIHCADGFSVSIQAGWGKHCYPRPSADGESIHEIKHAYRGPFHEWELGFPSAHPGDEIMKYIDGNPETTDPTQTVYGYVPTVAVLRLLEEHGGIAKEKQK